MENVYDLIFSRTFIIGYTIIFILLLCISIYHRKYRLYNLNLKKESFENTKNNNKNINDNDNNIIYKNKYNTEKKISNKRRKEIDSQQNKINNLINTKNRLKDNLDTEKELNKILVNESGNDLIKSLIDLLKRKKIISNKEEDYKNLQRLIEEKIKNMTDYKNNIDKDIFFQQETSNSKLLNKLQKEYNDLLNKEKKESEKELENVRQQYLDKENEKLLKYNKSMNDHYKYLKDERDKLNVLNIGNMIEDNYYNFIENINENISDNKISSSINNFNNINFNDEKSKYNEKSNKIINKSRINKEKSISKTRNNKNKNNKKILEGFNNTEEDNSEENEEESNVIEMEDEIEEDNTIYINTDEREDFEDIDNDLIVNFVNYILNQIMSVLNIKTGTKKNNFIISLFHNFKKILKVMFDEKNLLASGLIILVLSISLFFIDISS